MDDSCSERSAETIEATETAEVNDAQTGATHEITSDELKPDCNVEVKSEPVEENAAAMEVVHFLMTNKADSDMKAKENMDGEDGLNAALYETSNSDEVDFKIFSPFEQPGFNDYLLIKDEVCHLRDASDKDFQR